MAPKTKSKPKAAKAAAKPARKAIAPAAKPAASMDGSCCGTSCCGCPVMGAMCQRSTLLLWLMSFAIISAFAMVWHGQLLMPRYLETANLWLPESAMRPELLVATHAGVALIFAILFRMASCCAGGLVNGVKVGILITAPVAMTCVGYTLASQPVPADIVYMWGAGWVLQGAILGLMGGWLLQGKVCCQNGSCSA